MAAQVARLHCFLVWHPNKIIRYISFSVEPWHGSKHTGSRPQSQAFDLYVCKQNYMGLKYHLTFEVCEVILQSPAQMFTNKKNNAKMAWDYGRDPVCKESVEEIIHFRGLIFSCFGRITQFLTQFLTQFSAISTILANQIFRSFLKDVDWVLYVERLWTNWPFHGLTISPDTRSPSINPPV